jgi:hypothetical protein
VHGGENHGLGVAGTADRVFTSLPPFPPSSLHLLLYSSYLFLSLHPISLPTLAHPSWGSLNILPLTFPLVGVRGPPRKNVEIPDRHR